MFDELPAWPEAMGRMMIELGILGPDRAGLAGGAGSLGGILPPVGRLAQNGLRDDPAQRVLVLGGGVAPPEERVAEPFREQRQPVRVLPLKPADVLCQPQRRAISVQPDVPAVDVE